MTRECQHHGCSRPRFAKSLCQRHYMRQWAGRPMDRLCLDCEAEIEGSSNAARCQPCSQRHRTDARKSQGAARQARRNYGRTCSVCGASIAHRHPSATKCEQHGYPAGQAALERRLRQHGISHAEYQEMLNRQGRSCPGCDRQLDGLAGRSAPVVDHDHITGLIRGILCGDCNLALGHVRDKPGTLDRLIAYLSYDGTDWAGRGEKSPGAPLTEGAHLTARAEPEHEGSG